MGTTNLDSLSLSGNLTVAGTTTIAAQSMTDLTTTGNTTLGNAVTDTTGINGATTITSTSASALTVGANGATNPVLKVDASTASAAAGISLKGNAAGNGAAIAVISSGTNENLIIDGKGAGTVTIGSVSTGDINLSRATAVSGTVRVTSNGSAALVVGPNGLTGPALHVDASAATSITGLKVTSAAAAGGVAVAAISSGVGDENLTIDAKGGGSVSIGTVSSGGVVLGGLSYTAGTLNVKAYDVLQAGGASGITFNSTGTIGIYQGSGAPTVSAGQGSLYLRSDGSSTSTRMYVNTDGGTTWTAVTTAA